MESSQPKIQVIARAASILRSLEDQSDGLSLGEIASRVQLPRSTVQRIVTALAEEQLVIAATPKSRVKLGPALVRLANATSMEINQLVRPFMESLCRELGETIDLSVIQGSHAVFIDQLSGSHRLRAVSAVGERFPLYCTACGKSLLATLPDDHLTRYLDNTFEAHTQNTLTDPAAIRKEIQQVKRSGVAVDLEEYSEGICAVSIFFEDSFGRAYAISIPAPTTRFNRHQKQFRTALLNCRDGLAAHLGEDLGG